MPLLRAILRRLFYAAAALSTLLLVATLLLWPLSHDRWLQSSYGSASKTLFTLEGAGGRAYAGYAFGTTPPVWGTFPPGLHFDSGIIPPAEVQHWSYLTWNAPDPDMPPAQWAAPTFLGVCWLHLRPGAGETSEGIAVPCAHLALLFSIVPLLALRSIRRRRRVRRAGLCPKCGYDLRAHARGSLCPECATPVSGGDTLAGKSRG